jgi:hypothetical protein
MVFVGCTIKSKEFTYDLPPPTPPPDTSREARKVTLGYADLLIEPTVRERLLKNYKEDPLNKINEIIFNELKSAGLFDNIVMIPVEKTDDRQYMEQKKINLLMRTKLKEMKWEVPRYGGKQAGYVASYMAGGVLGSLIYGATKTEVYGVTILDVTLVEPESNKIYLEKEYKGRFKEITTKQKCDDPEKKSRMYRKVTKGSLEANKD